MRGRKAQNYELLMVFYGIALLVAVLISVLGVHSHLPADANLPSKTIMLTEKTFDTIEFMFQSTVSDVARQVHMDFVKGLASCPKVPSADSDKGTAAPVPTSPIANYVLASPDCIYPTFVASYQDAFSSALDAALGAVDARVPGFESIHPKSFIIDRVSQQFMAGQFMVSVRQSSCSGTNGNDASILVISRRPLAIHASARSVDGKSDQWSFDAQRDFMTCVPMSQTDRNNIAFIQSIARIKEVALSQIPPIVNNRNADNPITDADKQLLLTNIGKALAADQSLINAGVKQSTPQTSQHPFAYAVILDRNQVYVTFPNIQIAIAIYTFS